MNLCGKVTAHNAATFPLINPFTPLPLTLCMNKSHAGENIMVKSNFVLYTVVLLVLICSFVRYQDVL